MEIQSVLFSLHCGRTADPPTQVPTLPSLHHSITPSLHLPEKSEAHPADPTSDLVDDIVSMTFAICLAKVVEMQVSSPDNPTHVHVHIHADPPTQVPDQPSHPGAESDLPNRTLLLPSACGKGRHLPDQKRSPIRRTRRLTWSRDYLHDFCHLLGKSYGRTVLTRSSAADLPDQKRSSSGGPDV